MVDRGTPATSEVLEEHVATKETPFHFVDSGLDNVYLVGIKYSTSPSGRIVAEIPAVSRLMSLIARDLLFSSGALRGQEIRFLRKRLGSKAADFSKALRITPETLSRIENQKQAASDQLDVLVRMYYLLSCGDPKLSAQAKTLMDLLKGEASKKNTKIVMSVSSENEWSDVPVAA
jgi:transcriptional regulator with XRE-family HTH domain